MQKNLFRLQVSMPPSKISGFREVDESKIGTKQTTETESYFFFLAWVNTCTNSKSNLTPVAEEEKMKIIRANINFSFFKYIWHLSNTSTQNFLKFYIYASKHSNLAEYEKLKSSIWVRRFYLNCEQQQFSEIVKYRLIKSALD